MAIKTCPKGHKYDHAIYADNCPFCPSDTVKTRVNIDDDGAHTIDISDKGSITGATKPVASQGGAHTVIRMPGMTSVKSETGRRLVGVLVSYDAVSTGEVYKVYEGRTSVGRNVECDIAFPNDSAMSSKHLSIQFVPSKGEFRAEDTNSSNGSYVNGECYVIGDVIKLKSGDVIVLGATKLLFLAIPEF